jgi:hypothetical protein
VGTLIQFVIGGRAVLKGLCFFVAVHEEDLAILEVLPEAETLSRLSFDVRKKLLFTLFIIG